MLSLEQRVRMGKKIREWIDLIEESGDTQEITNKNDYTESKQYFWYEFYYEMQRRGYINVTIPAEDDLTDEQGEEFGKQECPFNQYKGIAYRAVPYDYLAFIADGLKKLDRYVKWRFKKRLL